MKIQKEKMKKVKTLGKFLSQSSIYQIKVEVGG